MSFACSNIYYIFSSTYDSVCWNIFKKDFGNNFLIFYEKLRFNQYFVIVLYIGQLRFISILQVGSMEVNWSYNEAFLKCV